MPVQTAVKRYGAINDIHIDIDGNTWLLDPSRPFNLDRPVPNFGRAARQPAGGDPDPRRDQGAAGDDREISKVDSANSPEQHQVAVWSEASAPNGRLLAHRRGPRNINRIQRDLASLVLRMMRARLRRVRRSATRRTISVARRAAVPLWWASDTKRLFGSAVEHGFAVTFWCSRTINATRVERRGAARRVAGTLIDHAAGWLAGIRTPGLQLERLRVIGETDVSLELSGPSSLLERASALGVLATSSSASSTDLRVVETTCRRWNGSAWLTRITSQRVVRRRHACGPGSHGRGASGAPSIGTASECPSTSMEQEPLAKHRVADPGTARFASSLDCQRPPPANSRSEFDLECGADGVVVTGAILKPSLRWSDWHARVVPLSPLALLKASMGCTA